MAKGSIALNLTDNGQTDTIPEWRGGVGTIAAEGTFGSGTLSAQYRLHDSMSWTAIDTTNLNLTADGDSNFELPRGADIRFSLSGATSPDIDIYML